jgi:cytoskeleton protein RodZ
MITTDRKQVTDNALKHSWGMRFRAAREAMNLTEKEAAGRLHLKAHIINIIEGERFSEGPPVIFMRGYIRSYGRLLNLTEKELNQALSQLDLGTPPAAPAPSQFRIRENNNNSSSIWSTLFVVIVLTGLVGVWWWNGHVRNATGVIAAATPTTTAEPIQTAAVTTTPPEAITPNKMNPILATPGQTFTPTSVPETPTTAKATPDTAPAITTASAEPTQAEITPQPTTPPAPVEANDQASTEVPVAATTPQEQPTVVINTPATPTTATSSSEDADASTTASNADDTTDNQPAPAKTHTTKSKLPNLADAEMATPEEGLDNEPSE